MLYDITKIQKYGKGIYTSEKIGVQYYFIVNCRVYTDDTKTRFWRVRFLMMFDYEDLWENYHDDENDDPEITKEMINDYKKDLAFSCAESYIAYNKTIDDVIKDCNNTIERYR